jgi:hypothetical protein
MNKYIRILVYFILILFTVTAQAALPPNSAIDNSNYPKLDSSTGIFHFPAVKVGFSIFEVDLKRISSLPMKFELLPNIKEIPEAPFPGDTTYYDIDTKLVEVPAFYIYTDAGKWEAWEASLNLLPDTNPLQIEFKRLEQLPFFPGIKTFNPQQTSLELSWETAIAGASSGQFKYEIHLGDTADFTPDSNTLQTTLDNQTEYEITGLNPDTKYYLLIIVEDGNGKRSQERNYVSFSTAMIKNGDTIAIKTTSLFGGNGDTRLTYRTKQFSESSFLWQRRQWTSFFQSMEQSRIDDGIWRYC